MDKTSCHDLAIARPPTTENPISTLPPPYICSIKTTMSDIDLIQLDLGDFFDKLEQIESLADGHLFDMIDYTTGSTNSIDSLVRRFERQDEEGMLFYAYTRNVGRGYVFVFVQIMEETSSDDSEDEYADDGLSHLFGELQVRESRYIEAPTYIQRNTVVQHHYHVEKSRSPEEGKLRNYLVSCAEYSNRLDEGKGSCSSRLCASM